MRDTEKKKMIIRCKDGQVPVDAGLIKTLTCPSEAQNVSLNQLHLWACNLQERVRFYRLATTLDFKDLCDVRYLIEPPERLSNNSHRNIISLEWRETTHVMCPISLIKVACHYRPVSLGYGVDPDEIYDLTLTDLGSQHVESLLEKCHAEALLNHLILGGLHNDTEKDREIIQGFVAAFMQAK